VLALAWKRLRDGIDIALAMRGSRGYRAKIADDQLRFFTVYETVGLLG